MDKNIFQGKIFWIILFGSTAILFILYMIFFSDNNLSKRHELNKKINNLEKSIADTTNKIENSYSYDQLKTDSNKLEQYGREKLNYQKSNEDVFIIVYE